jgi:hypothetical protein
MRGPQMSREARLNVQGLARREPLLMGCIKATPGHVIISSDASAGEPTVTTHFSQDTNYRWATFDGVGQRPYYDGHTLKIDDIYLMTASITPVGAPLIRAAWDREWPAGTFADQWLADPDMIKSALKGCRQMHKAVALGLSYGMGPKKLQKTLYEQGFDISFAQCKQTFAAYWSLFSGVRTFADRLSRQMERDGYIINPFGYRGVGAPHKSFNFFVQSAVSGLMHAYLAKLFTRAPYLALLSVIHDELLIECPEDKYGDAQQAIKDATDSLNEDLAWSVKLRFGCVRGYSWMEAK